MKIKRNDGKEKIISKDEINKKKLNKRQNKKHKTRHGRTVPL